MQILDNGNVLVGYGYKAAWTEFSSNGEVLCRVHSGPESGFYSGQIISYRVFKQEWVGLPRTKPAVALSGDEAAVSWNGATEVRSWVLQGAFHRSGSEAGAGVNGTSRRFADTDLESGEEFEFISAVPKTGFETVVPVPPDTLHSRLRIAALDKDGGFLGATRSMDWEPGKLSEEVAVYEGDENDDENGGHDGDEDQLHIPAAFMVGMGFMTARSLCFALGLSVDMSMMVLGECHSGNSKRDRMVLSVRPFIPKSWMNWTTRMIWRMGVERMIHY